MPMQKQTTIRRSMPSAENYRRRANSAPSMHDLPSVCDLVRDAYNKNKELREDPQRPLHRTLLQRQLWSKLQQTFRETEDTSVLAHRPALTAADLGLSFGRHSLDSGVCSQDADAPLADVKARLLMPMPSRTAPGNQFSPETDGHIHAASSSSSSSSSPSPSLPGSSTVKKKTSATSLAHRLKGATFSGRRSGRRELQAATSATPPVVTAGGVKYEHHESHPARTRRTSGLSSTCVDISPAGKAALPEATAQAGSRSFSLFRRSTNNNSSKPLQPNPPTSGSSKTSVGAGAGRPTGRMPVDVQARLRALI